MEFKNKTKRVSQNGITLIALIITIIVLLILAGVTISLITGNESAPKKAVEAKEKQNAGAEKEDIQMTVIGFLAKTESLAITDETELETELEGKVTSITKHNNHWDVIGNTGTEYILTKDGKVLTQDDLDSSINIGFTEIRRHDKEGRINFSCEKSINNNIINTLEWGIIHYKNTLLYNDDEMSLEKADNDANFGVTKINPSLATGTYRSRDRGYGLPNRLYIIYEYDGHEFIKYGEQIHVYYDDLPEI